jgi:hypothetical protein
MMCDEREREREAFKIQVTVQTTAMIYNQNQTVHTTHISVFLAVYVATFCQLQGR